jgi:hypothetical protein
VSNYFVILVLAFSLAGTLALAEGGSHSMGAKDSDRKPVEELAEESVPRGVAAIEVPADDGNALVKTFDEIDQTARGNGPVQLGEVAPPTIQ